MALGPGFCGRLSAVDLSRIARLLACKLLLPCSIGAQPVATILMLMLALKRAAVHSMLPACLQVLHLPMLQFQTPLTAACAGACV